MNIRKNAASIVGAVLALLVLAPIPFIPGVASAQNYERSQEAARIDGFDVKPVRQLTPGTDLDFTLYGTPGGVVTAKVDGTDSRVVFDEVEVGRYQGTYTIRSRDRLGPRTRVTANLRIGNQIASALLDDNLIAASPSSQQRGRRDGNRATAGGPRIDRFEVQPVGTLAPGEELVFTLYGDRGGHANIRIEGVDGKLFLDEVNEGVYQGSYTVRRRDRIAANSAVTANLAVGNRTSSVVLGRPLLASAGNNAPARRPARCAECGVVETTNIIETKGEGGPLGLIAGGLAGGVLGSRVGEGRGKTAAEIAGALGGAYAGNEVEKRTRKTKHYEVVVRLQDGGKQSISYETDPGFKEGDRVRIVNGTLARDQ